MLFIQRRFWQGRKYIACYYKEQYLRICALLKLSSQLPDVIYPVGKYLPALVFTDVGFMPTIEGENPIYSWDGYKYKKGKVVNNRQLRLLKTVSIESISKTYQLFLKN